MKSSGFAVFRKIAGFKPTNTIHLSAPNMRQAFRLMGKRVKRVTHEKLEAEFDGVSSRGRKKILEKAGLKLEKLEKLSRSGQLTVNGINWLERYLEAFYGFCEGAEILVLEGALLQSEAEVGCQTLMVQDIKSRVIKLIHSEEDSDFSRFGRDKYRYKLVRMEIAGRKITFFSYPEFLGWGIAIGINEKTGMVQTIDDLVQRTEFNSGYFWAPAVSFMTLDAGDMKIVNELIKKISKIPGRKFDGAYAIHLAQADGEEPIMKSIELGYHSIKFVEPKRLGQKLIVAQSNCPRDEKISRYSFSGKPISGRWSLSSAKWYVEMHGREKRLIELGKSAKWAGKNLEDSIKIGLELLSTPDGDVGSYNDGNGKVRHYFSGLPSRWTVAHLVAYVGERKFGYYIGKFLPKPVRGKEYSIKYKKDYKFAGVNILQEAKKELAAFRAS